MIERFNNLSPISKGLVAGLLLGLSFSPVNLAPLAIVGFAMLFQITESCSSARQVMYVTYPGLLLWNVVTTYWLTFATLGGGIAAILANAVLMTIPLALYRKVRPADGSVWFKAILAAAFWVSYEMLHLQWDLAWPWLVAGNAFANFPILVQYISVTGSLGISFWIVAGAVAALHARTHPKTAAVLIFVMPVVSLGIWALYTPPASETVEIVVAQPNYDSYLHNSGYDDTRVALEELIALSDSLRTPLTRAVFWPENAVMDYVHLGTDYYPVDRLVEVSRSWNTPIITGATIYKYYTAHNAPVVHRISNFDVRFNVYNSAAGFFPDGAVILYEKAKLVPIVERFPFVDFLGRFENPWVDWGRISGYGRGSEVRNYPIRMENFEGAGAITDSLSGIGIDDHRDLNTAQFRQILAPGLVCYDSVFPDWVRRFVLDGAGFVAIITNDGWWGNTSGHLQHFDFARLRAIETRRTVVRSANNGISGMILADGSVHSRTQYWERTALRLDVPVSDHLTIYTRFGDWLGWLSLIFVLFTSAGTFLVRRFKK